MSAPSSLLDRESEYSLENEGVRRPPKKTQPADLHPPRFKVLITCINKFSGDKAAANFEVWLDDYVKATGNCAWSDEQRAQWFS